MNRTWETFETENKEIPFFLPGAVKEKNGIRFTVSVPDGEYVTLILYDKESRELLCEIPFPEEARMGNFYSMKVCGLPWKRYLYNYKIGEKITSDPWARLLTHVGESEDRKTYCEMAFDSFDWKDDQCPDISYCDGVMYHLHVRNFTMQSGSGVRYRGTFKGLQEKIEYLKNLGINQVKLMPVYDHEREKDEDPLLEGEHVPSDEPKKEDFWGYCVGNYFALNRKYAATDNPIKEFKNMVKAFHENKIEVILDMLFPADMPVRMMLDCLTFWSREYHVDGFHIFGRDDVMQWLLNDPYLSKSKIILSYLPNDKNAENGATSRFAQCNDGFLMEARRLLKGDEGVLKDFAYRSKMGSAGSGVINYMVNHDGFTLMDLVSYDSKHNEENGENNQDGAQYNFSWNCGAEGPSRKKSVISLRQKQMKNAFLMVLLAHGTPMLMSGDEFGNSQNGNNNPYCLDNATSWVDWSGLRRNKKLVEFVRKAIAFRKEHPILHMPRELRMSDYKYWGCPDLSFHSKCAWYTGFEYDNRQIGMMYYGKYAGTDEYIYVAYNLNPLAQELALPQLPENYDWYKVIDTSLEQSFSEEGEQKKMERVRSCVFPARSIAVLIGRKVK